jgi:hypothetical protein
MHQSHIFLLHTSETLHGQTPQHWALTNGEDQATAIEIINGTCNTGWKWDKMQNTISYITKKLDSVTLSTKGWLNSN